MSERPFCNYRFRTQHRTNSTHDIRVSLATGVLLLSLVVYRKTDRVIICSRFFLRIGYTNTMSWHNILIKTNNKNEPVALHTDAWYDIAAVLDVSPHEQGRVFTVHFYGHKLRLLFSDGRWFIEGGKDKMYK